MPDIVIGLTDPQPEAFALFGLPEHKLYLEAENFKSCHIMGTPGYGKSTFMGHLIDQFLSCGDGVLLIDIKGALAEDVASRTKFPEKLIYVSPYDLYPSHHYWSLNPFSFDRTDGAKTQAHVENVVRTFARIGMVDEKIMAMIQEVLFNSAMLAMALPAPTMMDVWQMMFDKGLRQRLMDKRRSPGAWEFWDQFERKTPRDREHYLETTMRRLRLLLDPPWINNLLAQKESTLKIPEWLDAGKLIVCNFDQAKLGELSAIVLSNLVISQTIHEAQQRPRNKRTPIWRLAVDEFHECAPENFARIIHQQRTYGLFPVMANQAWEQIKRPETLMAAAKDCSVRVYLHGTGQQDEEGDDLALYTANVEIDALKGGKGARQRISLLPWSQEENLEQLATARLSQIARTAHKDEYKNMWDRLEASGRLIPRDTKDSDATPKENTSNRRKAQKGAVAAPPPEDLPRSFDGEAEAPGEHPAALSVPDGPEPAPLADKFAGERSALSGSDLDHGRGTINRGRAKGGQRHVPDPPEGP